LLIIMPAGSFLSFDFIMDDLVLSCLAPGDSSPPLSPFLAGPALSAPSSPSLSAQPALDPPFACRSVLPLAEQLLILASEAAASPPDVHGTLFVMLGLLSPLLPALKGAAAVQLTL
jgi:hypothetical protein